MRGLVREFLEDLLNSIGGQFVCGEPFRTLVKKSFRIENILGQGTLGLHKALAPDDISTLYVNEVKGKRDRSRA